MYINFLPGVNISITEEKNTQISQYRIIQFAKQTYGLMSQYVDVYFAMNPVLNPTCITILIQHKMCFSNTLNVMNI